MGLGLGLQTAGTHPLSNAPGLHVGIADCALVLLRLLLLQGGLLLLLLKRALLRLRRAMVPLRLLVQACTLVEGVR